MKALTSLAVLLALGTAAQADPGRCGSQPVGPNACFRANASFRPRVEPPVCRREVRRTACVVARND